MKKRDNYLPYGTQQIFESDIQAVIDTLKSDYLTTGPSVQHCEKALCDYVGAPYGVLFSSGTAALHGAMFAAGIGPGDEVIVPALSFAASANAVCYMGARPVFCDVDRETYRMSEETVAPLITAKTKAILPVHYMGHPCPLEALHRLCKKHGLIMIEDGAHAMGARYGGQILGAYQDMMMVSFHPVKHITSGEGGIIFAKEKAQYEKLKQFRNHGITREKNFLLHKNRPDYYYEQQYLGYNYRMTDFQAALLESQLTHLDDFLKKRRILAEDYLERLGEEARVILPKEEAPIRSAYHLFVIQLSDGLKPYRDEIYQRLKEANIGVNVHYMPIYYHPYYQDLGYQKGLCKNTEHIYEGLITLPLHPKMTGEDVAQVCQILTQILDKF